MLHYCNHTWGENRWEKPKHRARASACRILGAVVNLSEGLQGQWWPGRDAWLGDRGKTVGPVCKPSGFAGYQGS